MSETSSIGPRVNLLEKDLAVHEAVCAERYQQINSGISSLRVEIAERAARQENLVRGVTALLIAITALAEIARRWFSG